MMRSTITILCEDCKDLYDIIDGRHDPKKRQPKLRCPKSKNHKWREWNHPDKCPKCGTVLDIESGGPMELWD
jgi:Zn finger protein HypA/HybF involved in hydrogenase expression